VRLYESGKDPTVTTSDPQSTAQIAARALEDQSFAERILTGQENYPEVRAAMLKDLAESTGQDVRGFDTASPELLARYIQTGPKPGGQTLAGLANFAACW